MAKNSRIKWTNHTFNPWWICVKVGPARGHCYAESKAKRVGSNVFGVGSERRVFGDKHWYETLKWNAAAKGNGRRARVFSDPWPTCSRTGATSTRGVNAYGD